MSEHEALARFHYGVPRGTARSVIVGSAAPLKSYPNLDNFRLSPGKKDFTAPQGLRTSLLL
jgi:hypothetical protein